MNTARMVSNIIIYLCLVIFLAISINLVHFHIVGGGALHHVEQEEFVLILDGAAFEKDFTGNAEPAQSDINNMIQENRGYNDETTGQKDSQGGDVNGTKNNAPNDDSDDYRQESNAFRQIMERSASFQETCDQLPEHHLGEAQPKGFDTGVPPLPEHGVHKAMKDWLDKEAVGANERGDYPICSLPPSKSCDVDTFTLILMSHTVDDDVRLKKLRNGIKNLSSWKDTGEIILVWNSAKTVLTECEKPKCIEIVGWDADDSHPLRIFYSLENGLHNNLLNRYHPMLEPKHEAIVYFDDDGPFHSQTAMDVGFQLWKFNSDVQIGSMARNIRFPSKRMNDLQNEASDLAAKHYEEDAWQTHVHPYNKKNVEIKMEQHGLAGYPQFTPICHEQTGDVVEYNYFVFPNFKAHMSLPSGSILHRNYLCFVWHPAFEEMRQFILDHPTHPDDMTISTLVSHLVGKPLRTFPRNIAQPKEDANRRRLGDSFQKGLAGEDNNTDMVHEDMPRRRLLWQQKDWGNMREEAIDSIVGYFGSINPGSVGWCAGTEHQIEGKGRGNMRYDCISAKNPPPQLKLIPWMNEGGLGYSECH